MRRSLIRHSVWNFQGIMEHRIPDFKGRPTRSEEELKTLKASLPKITFVSSRDFDLLSKSRTNLMGEYRYQKDMRLKVTELLLAEAPQSVEAVSVEGGDETKQLAGLKALQNASEYAGELLESHIQTAQRVNDFVDANPVYLLDQPLREDVRWNQLEELDNSTRGLVRSELRKWLPSDFQQVKAVDIQQAAAFSTELRTQMFAKIEQRKSEAEREINQMPSEVQSQYRAILKAEIDASKNAVDPTWDITPERIQQTSDLETLREYAHRVAEYNGDSRLLAIFEKASSISRDTRGQELLQLLKRSA